ncbi:MULTISPECIES: hypothetical protein [unclassified Pseudomonas]|uniref:hypothetical protein n=1 Tax=unclassified Pseudomonas TaxID=196821 RepID=UPI00244977BA|nr:MULTISPECIES: hypothetical protein [unclassified Pseudomonas]MDH0896711.1 hypothetical protein [Pseudomonas sp. GD03875]MDH1066463.1 hypothetical protein [Pseudomonas sp. GD03985]
MSSPSISRAEAAFREAFDRLKTNQPELLPKSSPVSQNNVAREAGLDPSALKKARYPGLIAEIQLWIEQYGNEKPMSARQKELSRKQHSQDLKDRIHALQAQRDNLLSLLAEADAKILELTSKNEKLELALPANNIAPLFSRQP